MIRSAVLPLIAVASFSFSGTLVAQSSAPPTPTQAKPTVFILPFALADGAVAAPADLAKQTCSSTPARIENTEPETQPQVVSALSAELQTKLANGFAATVGTAEAAAPAGATVIAGCFTEIDGGNAKKRVVGAGMGASFLKAHVRILRMLDGKLTTLQEFDEESKGRNFGVGSGMLINAMRSKRTSLAGDAGNLADKVAKRFEKLVNAEK